eukprot:sb/3465089/
MFSSFKLSSKRLSSRDRQRRWRAQRTEEKVQADRESDKIRQRIASLAKWRSSQRTEKQAAPMRRSPDVMQQLTAPSLDWELSASLGLDWELNESSSTKGTASDPGFSKLQNSVTAPGQTTSVEDARSVNRHPQTRSGGAGERCTQQQQKQAEREMAAKRMRSACASCTATDNSIYSKRDKSTIQKRLTSSSTTDTVNNITSCGQSPELIDLTMDTTSPTNDLIIIPTEDHSGPASNTGGIMEGLTYPPLALTEPILCTSTATGESYKEARRMRRKRDAEIWTIIKKEMEETGEELMEGVSIDPQADNRRREVNRLYHARRRAKIRAYKKREGIFVAPHGKRSELGDLLDTLEEKRENKTKFRLPYEYWRKMRNITILKRLKDRNRQLEKELAKERGRADKAVSFLEEIESQLRAAL